MEGIGPVDPSKMGIYLNVETTQVVRITSPYWIPESPQWTLITNHTNASLSTIREIIKEEGIVNNVKAVVWTGLPIK